MLYYTKGDAHIAYLYPRLISEVPEAEYLISKLFR
jgi:hypothetical protein